MSAIRSALRFALPPVLALSMFAAVAPGARAATRSDVLQAAASYAAQQGYHVGIAVLDTKTGALRGAGYWKGIFASESLIKVFIATRLLVEHRMYGATAARAWKMITQSDDAIASAFYASVGGDGLVNWMKARYHVPDLGYPPSRAGWWGNTHLRPSGLVKLYAKLKRDRVVAPWLLNAMHHARPYGSDGTWQFFGIPSATKEFAVKQGWGNDYEIGSSSDFNTTGFIDHYRYAVAILARGPSSAYGSRISSLLTNVARRLLPGGNFPDPNPTMRSLSKHVGATAGGTRLVVSGTGFTHVTSVMFGDVRGRDVRVVSPNRLAVTAPPHSRSWTYVRVMTTHGYTHRYPGARFLFERGPAITGMSSHIGRTAGGSVVYLRGQAFTGRITVRFGSTPAASVTPVSRWRLKVVTPRHAAGTVDVRVSTPFGTSPAGAPSRYSFAAPPTITSISPAGGPTPGGNQVTITGTGFEAGSQVSFGARPATIVSRSATTSLVVSVPAAGRAGAVDVVVSTPFGSATATHGYSYS